MRPVGGYTFTDTPAGTSVTFALSADVTGVKKLLMGAAVQRSMDGEMAALDRAKALLES